MRVQTAIQKGKELENFIVDRLRLSGLDQRAYKQKGSGNGKNKGDVWNDLNLCLECKNQKQFKPRWFEQAEREGLGYQEPVIVWHPPYKPLESSMVFITWDYFESLLIKSKEPPKIETPAKELGWRLAKLKNAINEVLKELH